MKPVLLKEVIGYDAQAVQEAVEELFYQLPCTNKLNEQTKVVLKPNLLAKHPPMHAVTTHPVVLQATIQACLKRGVQASNITVVDSAGGLYNPSLMRSLYKVTGLQDVCKQFNVCCYDACKSKKVQTTNPRVASSFEIIEPVLEADFIINLPKMKTHVMTGLTCACKNMFGVIPGLEKSQWHMRFPDKERFGAMLLDLLDTIQPDMAIVDGILAMEGDGPAGGHPREVNKLLASEDMLSIDFVIAHLMSLDPNRIPYLSVAMQQMTLPTIEELVGNQECTPIPNWQLPKSYQSNHSASTSFVDCVPKIIQPIAKKLERNLAPRPIINKEKCIGCGKCKEICSKNAIKMNYKKAHICKKDCIHCFCCHEVCPVKAIDIKESRLLTKF